MGEARRESVDITAPVSSRSVDKRYNAAIAVMGILTLLVAAVLLISRLAPNSSTLAPQSAQPSDTYSDFSGDSPIEGTEPAPEFGIVVDGDMRVVDLERGSAAELAGIQRGDVILRLEGIPLTLPAQARQTAVDLFSSRPGKDITVTINRGGQSTSVQVIPAPRADKGGSSENPVPTATPVVEPYTYF
jgi:S1-C subfamily serine protease